MNERQSKRFFAKVQKTETCWNWLGGKREGYGLFYLRGATRGAHRVSYAEFVGEIPKGNSVLHRCDNPACVNPQHLFTGTHLDNMKDASAKNRLYPSARLARAKAIFEASKTEKCKAVIAKQFGVSLTTVCYIASGKSWKFLKG